MTDITYKCENLFGYWMVHCPERGEPRIRHESYEDAEFEARRLAQLNPGCRFFILCAAKLIVVGENVERTLSPKLDSIPF